MSKPPRSVKGLNAWLLTTFQCLEGVQRSWLSFPLSLKVETSELYFEHRIAFVTLALRGQIDLCCKEIAFLLCDLPTREELQDHTALLFIRQEFTRSDDFVYGRVAFWHNTLNEKLRASRCYKAEGAIPNRALEEEA